MLNTITIDDDFDDDHCVANRQRLIDFLSLSLFSRDLHCATLREQIRPCAWPELYY